LVKLAPIIVKTGEFIRSFGSLSALTTLTFDRPFTPKSNQHTYEHK